MQRLRHLVVVVPGIGGSELAYPGRAPWALTASALARVVVRPAFLDLDRAGDLQPVGLVRTFTTFAPIVNITGYDGLTDHLHRTFRDVRSHTHRPGVPVPTDVDLLCFPYDFRRSITEAARSLADVVGQALAGVAASARRNRVIVLAHSLGGLVARYWVGALDGWRVCTAVLTLGTPHRGAPKALDWLVNGPGVGRLRHPGVARVLRGWPSVYELLPQYPAIWDAASGCAIEPYRLSSSVPGQRRLQAYASEFEAGSARARRVHDDIAASWAQIPTDRLPAVVPYFGRGHATINLVKLATSGTLAFSKEDPAWRGNVGWAGDGTVPALSAIPMELGDHRATWRGIADRHGEMASTSEVLDLLASYAGESIPTRGADQPSGPWLGLDVDDVVPAAEPVSLGVRVLPNDRCAEVVCVTLSTADAPCTDVFSGRLSPNGDRWEGLLPALAPGRYRLTLEAKCVEGPESVFRRVDVVALEPDRDDEAVDLGASRPRPAHPPGAMHRRWT